jgi:hypothetical protein
LGHKNFIDLLKSERVKPTIKEVKYKKEKRHKHTEEAVLGGPRFESRPGQRLS